MKYAVRVLLLLLGLVAAGCSTPGLAYWRRPNRPPAGAPPFYNY